MLSEIGQNSVLVSWPEPTSGSYDDININGFWLSNLNCYVTSFNISPKSDLKTYDRPLVDGKWFLSYNMRGWEITMDITIRWETTEEFMDLLKQFRENAYKENWLLQYKINWETRKSIVNCVSNPFNFLSYNITFLSFSVSFSYLDFTFWAEKQTLSLFDKSNNFSQEITNKGTQDSQLVFYFVFKIWTNLSKLKIINGDDYIEINENFSWSDILVIDWEKKSVIKNNVEIDFDNVLLTLFSWSNRLYFEFEGDFSSDIYILNNKNYS